MKYLKPLITKRNYAFFKKSNVRKNDVLKLVLCGAAGKIGQIISLLLKQSPYVEELALYDIKDTRGIGLELSHIDTQCQIKAYHGAKQLCDALNGAKIVAIVANTQQNTTKNLFEANANIISNLMCAVAEYCPEALIGIATNPLNSIVPVAVNVMQTKVAKYDPKKIFGINSVDIVRANTLAANILGLHPERVTVPIIGGHSKHTIVPLFSRFGSDSKLEMKDIENLSKAVSDACESCDTLDENENASLTASFAIARFISILAMAIKTKKSIIECAYVKSTEDFPTIKYCSTPLRISALGIEQNLGFPKMTEYEKLLFKKSSYYLKKDIELGESYSLKDENILQMS